MTSSPLLLRVAPALFVLLWSTGWIAARAAAPYADPLTFLSARYALAGLAMLGIALLIGAEWPRTRAQAGHAVFSGLLLHAVYLGGVWWAVKHGLSAGVSGLIAAVQPILTALLAPQLAGERIRWLNWLGIAAGFLGIGLVLAPKLTPEAVTGLSALWLPVGVNLAAMLAVTLGTFYQKRFLRSANLATTTFLQYVGALAATLPAAALLEPMHMELTTQCVLTLAWSVAGLSIGAIALLLVMINKGAVSRAAALIYLVPPSVALEAYLLFGETLAPAQLAGMGLTGVGVALATRRS